PSGHDLPLFPLYLSTSRQAATAVCLSAAVMRKRLAWQKLMPARPLRASMTSWGWPAQEAGKGSLGFLVRWSVTHWALQPPRWLGYTTNKASVLYRPFFQGR